MDIKLGANQIDAGAKNLLTIKKQFEADPKEKQPSVLYGQCGLPAAGWGICGADNGTQELKITAFAKKNCKKESVGKLLCKGR